MDHMREESGEDAPPSRPRRRWYHVALSFVVFVVLIPAGVRGVLNAGDDGKDEVAATVAPPPGHACERYAGRLAASYKRTQHAHPRYFIGQHQAIADTLHETQSDAPDQLVGQVAVLVDGFAAYVEAIAKVDLSHAENDPVKIRETLAESPAVQIFTNGEFAKANFEIWRTCPNLDSAIGSNTLIGDTLLAIGGSESEMDEESLSCMLDRHAQNLGDNSGCDALQRACSDANFNACNDLHDFAYEGTAYQLFGSSCGEIAKPDDKYVAGLCDMRNEAP